MTDQQPEAPAIPGVTRWRKKPIVITAIQFTGGNVSEIWDAFGADGIYGPTEKNPDHLILTTIHGDPAPARAGDWVIPDGKPGTFYPCKPDVFAATYEPASAPVAEAGGPARLTREQVREMVFAANEEGWWAQGGPASERVTDAIWPLLERAQAAEAKLAAIRVSARDSGRVVAIHPDDGTYAAKEISFAAGSSRSLAEIIAAFEHSNHLGSEEPGDGG